MLQSQSRLQEALFFQLAACALQAEVGDLELVDARNNVEVQKKSRQDRTRGHYFLPEDYFPSWVKINKINTKEVATMFLNSFFVLSLFLYWQLIKHRGRDFLLQHSRALHSEMKGASRSQAILQFIREAGGLQDGPVTFYRMRKVRH